MKFSKSKSKITKLRGGAVNPPLSAKQVATLTVNAFKDGSIHAIAILIACQAHPKIDNFVKVLIFGDKTKTEALINEIAANLYIKRQAIILKLVNNPEMLKNFNRFFLEAGLIETPITLIDLGKAGLSSIFAWEVPIVKSGILACQSIIVLFFTNKIRQFIITQLGQQITKGIIAGILSALTTNNVESFCVDMTEIEKLKQGTIIPKTLPAVEPSLDPAAANNILTPRFNDKIIDFIDIEPTVEKLFGSQLFENSLIHYSPKFNVDYVIERLTMGTDISKLPRDHITNLWNLW